MQPCSSMCARSVSAAVAVLDSPARAAFHHAAQFVHGYGQRARGADAGGHVAEELVHEFAQPRLDLLACEPRRHQPHAAVDVVADTAGRDDSLLEIKRRDATDREAVTPMDIWHRERRGDDAGQVRDVGGLLRCFVANDLRDHLLGRVNARRHTHAAGLRQFPEVIGELADVVVHGVVKGRK